jgi:hypothetical protein
MQKEKAPAAPFLMTAVDYLFGCGVTRRYGRGAS